MIHYVALRTFLFYSLKVGVSQDSGVGSGWKDGRVEPPGEDTSNYLAQEHRHDAPDTGTSLTYNTTN